MIRRARFGLAFAAAVVVVGVTAFALSRLAGSIAQLRAAVEVLPAGAAELPASAAREPASAVFAIEPRVGETAGVPTQTTEPAEPAVAVAANGDERILRWLAAEPEFQRGAAELLNDPDLKTREEARAFLRELGVPVPER